MMSDGTPPLARDLAGIGPGYTWKFGEAGAGGPAPEHGSGMPPEGGDGSGGGAEVDRLRAQVRQLTSALEDVVALALSGADYKERAIMMHRRAVAALSGVPGKVPAAPPTNGARPGQGPAAQ